MLFAVGIWVSRVLRAASVKTEQLYQAYHKWWWETASVWILHH